jgi:hypothetical protein
MLNSKHARKHQISKISASQHSSVPWSGSIDQQKYDRTSNPRKKQYKNDEARTVMEEKNSKC